MGAGSSLAHGTLFLHTELVADRVFYLGDTKFSPAALKDTITGLVGPILVDFGWSEEKTKEMCRAEMEPAPEGRENFCLLEKAVKAHPLSLFDRDDWSRRGRAF